MNTIYLGIDPGASGGLAALSTEEPAQTVFDVCAEPMPDTERDIWDWIKQWGPGNDCPHCGPRCDLAVEKSSVVAVIERVGGFIQGADKGRSGGAANGSTMFKFGAGYGRLRMALIGAGIPFDEVTPQKWQQVLGVQPRKKGEPKSELKNRCKAKAQQLFPGIKVTLATADSLLIAEFARRCRVGSPASK